MVALRQSLTGHIRRLVLRLCLVVPLLPVTAATSAGQDTPVPELKHYATDLSGTLSADQISQLDQLLSSFDKTTSTQVVVLMVSSLNGEDLEEYSLRVAEANKVGKKGKDNGALLLVARNDRKARIEVGYGLEGALPDALAGQIIRQEISPHFRQGDYYGGLRAGVEAIMAATKNEYKAEPASQTGRRTSPGLFIVVVIIVILLRLVRWRSRGIFWGGGPWLGGGGGGGWGGGSGGGFGGGGGSFGGGGASGSW
jgi:uncharacterized protein